MHPAHIAVTIAMGLCGSGALIGHFWPGSGLLAISFYLGWWATAAAIVIGFVFAVVLLYRVFSRSARPLFAKSWLALLNGGIALVFWVVFIDSMSANPSIQSGRAASAGASLALSSWPAADFRRWASRAAVCVE